LPQLPGPLRLTPSFPFVGRARELTTLRSLMPRAEAEGRRVALVGGEAGSGKSRLVRELAQEANTDGVLVLYGACDAVVRTPYQPFAECLDQIARICDPGELRSDLGTTGGELVRLLPDLALRVGELPPPVEADPDTERHRLHMAVTDLLTNVSRRRPLLLVLEDGHWADTSTLVLLRHLARSAGETRMLLLATFRDTEADVPETLAEALADLRRSEDVVRLRLGGLSGDEVEEFVRRAGGESVVPELNELARAISDLTEGNAFLLCELWRALVETGTLAVVDGGLRLTRPLADLGTPEGVREVVSQRLTRLSPSTTELLELAAVVGSVFEVRILERASPLPSPDLLGALDEAVRTGLIEEISAFGLSHRFTHELVRRALFDRLPAARRAELHLRVAEALEQVHHNEVGRVLADLAYHYAAAGPAADVHRAVDYNVRAARAARASLAFDQASTHLATALELGIEDPVSLASAYHELGVATHLAGRSEDALEAFTAAAEVARQLGDRDLLAEAAIGYENSCWRPGIVDRNAVELLEEAATALDEGDSELRVGVLSGLARALANRGDHERAGIVRTNAIEMARRLDDRRGLATILMRSNWARGTNTLEEILEMLDEAYGIAEELDDVEMRAEIMEWRAAAHVGLGDLGAAQREIDLVLELAEQTRQPFIFHVAEHYQAALALCRGRLGDAEAAAERSHEWSRYLTGRDASGVYGIQMFSIRREQGRLPELAPLIRMLASGERPGGTWRPGLAVTFAELGMDDEARAELDRIAGEGLAPLRESLWLASLTYLADACVVVDHGPMASILYPELASHTGTNVTIGYGVMSYGAADRYLGMLASILGEPELAERHFDAAMELNRVMGADTWLAHTAYEYGRLLLAHDGDRAGALLGEAASLAERIGMPALLGRIRRLGAAPVVSPGLPDDLSAREVQILRLVARGLSNREIGTELVISEHTAANHIRSILRKTGCANRTEAATYAHRRGLAE
jgi:DNA-binding CsgD family transcriptional regulator/tetratricopeptide (TPR) repeat protein